MLFSDIVGFTSICSTATPFMVVNMLECLYNKFDAYCGQLDIYKVSNVFISFFFTMNSHRFPSSTVTLEREGTFPREHIYNDCKSAIISIPCNGITQTVGTPRKNRNEIVFNYLKIFFNLRQYFIYNSFCDICKANKSIRAIRF